MSTPLDDDALRAAYAARTRTRTREARGAPAQPTDTVSDDQLLALVEQRGSEAERLATLDRVMASPSLRAEYEVMRAAWQATDELAAANRTAHAPLPAERTSTSSWLTSASPWPWRAAAGMLVVVGAGSWLLFANRGTRADDTMRGRADASAPLVAAVTADDSLRLAWPAERDVRAYRVELLDDAGEVVSSREGSDTTAIWSVRAVASARRAWVRTTRVNGSTRITPAITLPKMPTTPR